MRSNSNMTGPPGRNSPWLRLIKLLFLVLLLVIIFLLAQDMVRHRFFRGGRVNQRDVLKP